MIVAQVEVDKIFDSFESIFWDVNDVVVTQIESSELRKLQ